MPCKTTDVQTILVPARKGCDWARKWAWNHDFKAAKCDRLPSGSYLRLRQFDPGECVPGSFGTLPPNKHGIRLVTCRRKATCGLRRKPRRK